jgi:transposase
MCGWIKKGKDNNKNIKTNTRYHRLNITGAVDVDTLDVVSHFSKKMNEETTLDFLEKLRVKFPKGKLHLVLDNAGYYNTSHIRQYAESMAIELLYLPPYSPNLNIVERLWLYFQKVTLYNRYYETFEKFEKACRDFFKNAWRHKGSLKSLLTEYFEIVCA